MKEFLFLIFNILVIPPMVVLSLGPMLMFIEYQDPLLIVVSIIYTLILIAYGVILEIS